MKLTDEELSLAARQVCCAIAGALPDAGECRHTFSPAFRRKMRPLLRRGGWHAALRHAAAVLLAALVGVSA